MLLKAFYTACRRFTGTPEIYYSGRYKMIDPNFRLSVGLSQRQFLTLCCAFDYDELTAYADNEENSVRYYACDGYGLTFSGDEEWIKGCVDDINAISGEEDDCRKLLCLKTEQSSLFKEFFDNMYTRLSNLSGKFFNVTKMRLSSNKTDYKMVDVLNEDDFNAYGPWYCDIVLETPDEKNFLLYSTQTEYMFMPGIDETARIEIADVLFG